MKIRVYYEDTDCGGIVYYANYLKFCERARSEKFFANGKSPEQGGYAFVVHALNAKYFAPAKLGDLLDIYTRTKAIKGASVELEQAVWRGETRLFAMQITLACVDMQSGRGAKIPQERKNDLEWNEWKN